MPQTDFESTITGRNSRASNFSNGSRGTYRRSIRPRADSLAAAPGVQSMLKTSTEIGNVGSLAAPGVRSPPFRSGVHQRHGASSRMSTGSAQSQQSKRTSYHHTFPSVSSTGRRCSMTRNVLSPSFDVQPDFKDMSDPTVLPPQPAFLKDSCRSYSLTNTSRHPSFPNYRSLTSLRSHDPVQRPRSPYRYPTRLKRPGYRPSSPAMSDVTGLQQSRLQNSVAVKHKVVLPQPSMPFTKHPNQYSAFRNRCTPFVNVVERLEQKALLFPVSRKSSPALTDKASLSVSSKTCGQTPSDGPSSDPPSSTPPTPRDIALGTTPKITIAAHVAAPIPFPSVSGKWPMYYDYGEDFEQFEKHVTQVYEETTSSPIPMGFVHRIKALLEERAASSKNSSPISQSRYSLTEKATEPNIPELPASPVLKRITREMILAAIGPVSDIADSEVTIKVDEADDTTILQNQLSLAQPTIAELPADNNENRKSALSVPDSIASALTSSTPQFEYALRYSMPVSTVSLQSNINSISCDGDEEMHTVEQDAIQETPLVEHGNSKYSMKCQHSTPNLSEGIPVPELGADIEPPIAHYSSSSPFVSSSRHSIPTSYTAAPSSESVRTPENSSDYARPVAVPIESEKEVVCSYSTPRIEVYRTASKIDAHEECSLVHPQGEEVPFSTAGSVSPISTLIATETTPTACRDSVSTTHLSVNWSYRKPISSSTTPVDSPKDSSLVKRSSIESTTDLRFSSYRPHAVQLPDLKEESETSLDRNSNVFRFPRPGSGIPLVPIDKIRRTRDPLSPRAESAHSSAFKSHHTHSLSETRGIPSLQFSQINLFAKLNDAFESRHRLSMDGYAIFVAPTPERSTHTDNDMIREKYRSLFGSLDADHEPEEHFDGGNDSQHEDVDEENEEFSRHATVAFTAPTLRPLSPDELIAEVDRISIPSINGLTQRLSEFLPSLKKYYHPEGKKLDEEAGEEEGEAVAKDLVDEAVEVTINEIRSIGKELESENSKRDSVEEDYTEPSPSKSYKLRPISADIRPKSTPPEKRPATPLNLIQEKLGGEITHLTELDTPTPAALRSRSLSVSNLDGPSHHMRIPDAVCNSRHSPIGRSPPESRPWNLDTSYPWAHTNPDIAIHLPAPTHRKDSAKMQPSPLRLRISSSSSTSSPSGISATLHPSAHRTPSDAGDHTSTTADTFQPRRTHPQRGPSSTRAPASGATARKSSKRTLLGSLSRRIGLARSHSAQSTAAAAAPPCAVAPAVPSIDVAACAAALPPHASPPPPDPARPVDPGDRYPTSALLSPAGAAFGFAFGFDGEARSFFSEESSVGEGPAASVAGARGRLRRITALRGRGMPLVAEGDHAAYECVDVMGRSEVRARRLLQRIKAFWYRGGEILRTMSLRAGRRVQEDDEGMSWLERVLVRSEDVQGLESGLCGGSIAACAPPTVEINDEVGSEERVQEEHDGEVVELDGDPEEEEQQ